jgi:hypothetical protein
MRFAFWCAGLTAVSLAPAPLTAQETLVIPTFQEETASAGIDSVYTGEWEYMVGGGVATFDCNEDGFADMMLAGGASPAKFYRNVSAHAGALRFELHRSGLEVDRVTGAYPLDIDSDGITDLVLLRVGENLVMRGRGMCRFERANELWRFDGGDAWSTAFAAIWEQDSTWPTIAIGNYIDRFEEMSPWGSCTDNWLHRPRMIDGGSETMFSPPIALSPSFCALSMLFTDWDRSGTPSLRISNDREYYEGGEEQLWRIEPKQPPRLFSVGDGWKPLRIWGMGIASYDLNSDGFPEYFLTSMADNKLQSLRPVPEGNRPQPSYADIAFAKGVTAHRPYVGGDVRPSTAWHTQFEDVNNDGLIDLFIAKGNVAEMPDFATNDPNNLLLQFEDGRFRETGEAAGIVDFARSRGAALTDFNLDGLLDLVVVNRWDKARLWRNVTRAPNSWLGIKLQQPDFNRDAIGAWLEVRCGTKIMRREIAVGGGHASGQNGWWHFGLGNSPDAEVRVVWPDGTAGGWHRVDSNSFYIVRPGELPRAYRPGPVAADQVPE